MAKENILKYLFIAFIAILMGWLASVNFNLPIIIFLAMCLVLTAVSLPADFDNAELFEEEGASQESQQAK